MSRTRWDLDQVVQTGILLGSTGTAAGSTSNTVTGINLSSTAWDTSRRYLVACHTVSTSSGTSTRSWTFTVTAATASAGSYSTANLAAGGSVTISDASSGSTSGGGHGVFAFYPKPTHPFVKVKCTAAGAQAGNVSAILIGLPSVV